MQFAPAVTATADANGYYEVILPSAVRFRLIYAVSNYSGRIDYVSFAANTRRDVTLVPSWSRLGSGNAAFDVPRMPSRVQLDASSDEPVADFAMRVGGVMVVSQTLRKTTSLTATYSNVHQINGGWVEISASPGVRWSFRRVE